MSKNKGKIFDSLNIIQISNASVNSLSKRSWNFWFFEIMERKSREYLTDFLKDSYHDMRDKKFCGDIAFLLIFPLLFHNEVISASTFAIHEQGITLNKVRKNIFFFFDFFLIQFFVAIKILVTFELSIILHLGSYI